MAGGVNMCCPKPNETSPHPPPAVKNLPELWKTFGWAMAVLVSAHAPAWRDDGCITMASANVAAYASHATFYYVTMLKQRTAWARILRSSHATPMRHILSTE